MRPIQLHCPRCGGLFQTDTSMSGKQVACPHCRGTVAVPQFGSRGEHRETDFYPPGYPPAARPRSHPAGASALGDRGTKGHPSEYAFPPGHTPSGAAAAGFDFPEKTQITVQDTRASDAARVERLLPPAVDGSVGVPPGSEVPLSRPQDDARPAKSPRRTPEGAPMIPISDGGYFALREPLPTAGRGEHMRELRQLTAAEKSQWRFKKNLVLWIVGAAILAAVAFLMLLIGPL